MPRLFKEIFIGLFKESLKTPVESFVITGLPMAGVIIGFFYGVVMGARAGGIMNFLGRPLTGMFFGLVIGFMVALVVCLFVFLFQRIIS